MVRQDGETYASFAEPFTEPFTEPELACATESQLSNPHGPFF